MDKLPAELLHLVCTYIKKHADIKTFRLLSRGCAAVGLEYLLPVVQVTYLQSAWDRLEQISQHPVLRHHVHTLLFEQSLMDEHNSIEEYKENFYVPTELQPGLKEPTLPHDIRDGVAMEAYMENFRAVWNYKRPVSSKELNETWKLYQRELAGQRKLYETLQRPGVFKPVLNRLSNLKSIRIQSSIAWVDNECAVARYNHADRLLVSTKEESIMHRPNLLACSILQDVVDLDLRLDQLIIGYTNWRLLQTPSHEWTKMMKAFNSIKTLRLAITTHDWDAGETEIRDEVAEFNVWKIIEQRKPCDHLSELFNSVPDLEKLDIMFDTIDVKTHTGWLSPFLQVHPPQHLRVLRLGCINTDESSLEELFNNCASSLKDLTLAAIELTSDADCWLNVLLHIAKVLQLDGVRFEFLLTTVTDERYDFSPASDAAAWKVGRKLEDTVLLREADFPKRFNRSSKTRAEIDAFINSQRSEKISYLLDLLSEADSMGANEEEVRQGLNIFDEWDDEDDEVEDEDEFYWGRHEEISENEDWYGETDDSELESEETENDGDEGETDDEELQGFH